ncbi:D-TA family PLP-dependent enzyme [Lacihabitans sp. CCS-44]|uniref:D-TA family PLP-dependent enzyme n=1 Tax=Lacihabitans sp. CCS-44 TaxID=2487331 RepID=UPI0020CC80C1|nr:D-TA family PLP-dependent enzyme [Lacihabitans sp. CCS-44]MCP9757436.1 D-TA family PLP-dependent enzyme [Lacihabitans sp. CCS-44]
MTISNFTQIDSPSLLILKEKVEGNIDKMIAIAGGDSSRLMPHIKTNKMENVVRMMISKGIRKFKAATVAEAELAAMAGAEKVLISHQLLGPKIDRLLSLIEKYPNTKFASLADCNAVVDEISEKFSTKNPTAEIYYDINNGMDRSGHEIDDQLADDLKYATSKSHTKLSGLHVYDGHIRDDAFGDRKAKIESGMKNVYEILAELKPEIGDLEVIAGGTPAFTSHASEISRTLSPGTCVLWDWGYGDKFAEQNFEFAALVMSRIISKPKRGILTTDMGHKAISSENPIDKRIRFLNHDDLKLVSQSEEHGVIETSNWDDYEVGDIILGVPYHVCPTVNLYDEAQIIENSKWVDTWKIEGRKRKITV